MLLLMWSKEAGIKEAVIEAYRELYLPSSKAKGDVLAIARNLIRFCFHSVSSASGSLTLFSSLTEDASLAEITSLEELVTQMMAKKLINDDVIHLLWDIFGKNPSFNFSRVGLTTLLSWQSEEFFCE